MKKQIDKEIALVYQQRRLRSEDQAAERKMKYLSAFPELKKIEDDLTAENAKLALKIISDGVMRNSSEKKEELIRARIDYLTMHRIPENYDAPEHVCGNCRDTGYDLSAKNGRCSCYLDLLVPILYKHSNFPGISKYDFSGFEPALFSDKKDDEVYRSKNSPREQIIAVREASGQFVSSFDEPGYPGLFFIGSPGTGKTYMAGCIANALIKKGISVLYMGAPEMFDIINEYRVVSTTFSPDKERLEKASDAYSNIMDSDLLIVDDLGTETFNTNRQPELLAVINHRTGLSKKMIITTNLGMSDLMNFYDERLISRIYGGFSVYKFFGEDLRMAKRKIKGH